MSSFIVSKKDLKRITNLIIGGMSSRSDLFDYELKNELIDLFRIDSVIDYENSTKNGKKIVVELLKNNANGTFKNFDFDFIEWLMILKKELEDCIFYGKFNIELQDLKTLQCYYYQCCDKESNLNNLIKKIESCVAIKICENMPEYESCSWGEYDE